MSAEFNLEQNLTLPEVTEKRSLLERMRNAFIVTAAGGSLVFEQSPANEALRINLGLDVLKSTQSSVAVGAAIFGTTAAIEGVSSGLITAGLHAEGGAVQKLKARLSQKNRKTLEQKEDSDKNHALGRIANEAANVGIALGLGAGLVTLKEHMKDENPSLKNDIKNSAKATTIVSGVSGAIGYLAAGGINHANGTIFERPAELFVDYGTDSKFWIGALTVGYGLYFAKKGVKKLFHKKKNTSTNEANIRKFLEQRGVIYDDGSSFDVLVSEKQEYNNQARVELVTE